MTGLLLVLAVALIGPPALAAGPPPIDAFEGRWQAREIRMPTGAPAPEEVGISISPSSNGFRLAWSDLSGSDGGKAIIDARFVKSTRSGVFEYASEQGSFLDRIFASPSTGNPLQGETLLWARIDAGTLAVYSLDIDGEGGFHLDHYVWTRTEDGLRLHYSQRTEDGGDRNVVEGMLIPAGG